LELKKSKLEGEYDLILWKSKRAEEEIKSYFSFEQELENHEISMTGDIHNFVSTVRCMAEYGYDPLRVVKEFNDIQLTKSRGKLQDSKTKVGD
jgi:hypothetical protein